MPTKIDLDVFQLNRSAYALLENSAPELPAWSVETLTIAEAQVFDFRGADCPVEAGQLLAKVSAGNGLEVQCTPAPNPHSTPSPIVRVASTNPVTTCLAAQYAGWPLAVGDYFAMVSGPIRPVRGREPLFEHFSYSLEQIRADNETRWVAVLETDHLPTPEVIQKMAGDCHCRPDQLVLCIAGTASPAGTLQVVARSLETALHQWETLGGDLSQIQSGVGQVVLPPTAPNSLTAIGWTNDAIIYHGEVTIDVTGDWHALQEFGRFLPSVNSPSFGQRFLDLFQAASYDFYKLDPRLFSPAVVVLKHLPTGQQARFGERRPELLKFPA